MYNVREGTANMGYPDGSNPVMIDYKCLTWEDMSAIVNEIAIEMKRRNPIGINMYAPTVKAAAYLLKEIADAEADNPTSEVG